MSREIMPILISKVIKFSNLCYVKVLVNRGLNKHNIAISKARGYLGLLAGLFLSYLFFSFICSPLLAVPSPCLYKIFNESDFPFTVSYHPIRTDDSYWDMFSVRMTSEGMADTSLLEDLKSHKASSFSKKESISLQSNSSSFSGAGFLLHSNFHSSILAQVNNLLNLGMIQGQIMLTPTPGILWLLEVHNQAIYVLQTIPRELDDTIRMPELRKVCEYGFDIPVRGPSTFIFCNESQKNDITFIVRGPESLVDYWLWNWHINLENGASQEGPKTRSNVEEVIFTLPKGRNTRVTLGLSVPSCDEGLPPTPYGMFDINGVIGGKDGDPVKEKNAFSLVLCLLPKSGRNIRPMKDWVCILSYTDGVDRGGKGEWKVINQLPFNDNVFAGCVICGKEPREGSNKCDACKDKTYYGEDRVSVGVAAEPAASVDSVEEGESSFEHLERIRVPAISAIAAKPAASADVGDKRLRKEREDSSLESRRRVRARNFEKMGKEHDPWQYKF